MEVFDHPWIKKYRYKRFEDDYGSEDDVDGLTDKHASASNNSDGEQHNQDTNFDSDPVQLDNRSSRDTSSPNSFMNSELGRGKADRQGCIN